MIVEQTQEDVLVDNYDRPNILICGPSGSGKSTSYRNLPPEKTIILSTEMRPFPFKGGKRFKMRKKVENMWEFKRTFSKALSSTCGEIVLVDSFTSLSEFAYTDFVRNVEKVGDNVRGAWLDYRDELHDILINAKRSNKIVVFTAIDELITDDQGRVIKTAKVQGSLKGNVEKEFDLCLWTKVTEPDPLDSKAKRWKFCTNGDGSNKAKTPMDMYEDLYIDNDLASVIDRCKTYYLED